MAKKYYLSYLSTLIMDGTITFDKEVYQPGDTITATFQIQGDLHKRLRDVELTIEVIEEVAVRYRTTHTSSGSTHSSTRTVREQFVIAGNHIELPAEEVRMGYQLQVQLPHQMPAIVFYDGHDLDISVTAFASIKFDVSWGSDTNIDRQIDIRAFPNVPNQPSSDEMAGLRASIPGQIVYGDETIPLYLESQPDFNEGFRKIRIEFEAAMEGTARGRSEREFRNLILWEGEDLPPRLDLHIPPGYLPTTSGMGFGISHALKVVLDKRMATDINLFVPIIYVPHPVDGMVRGEPTQPAVEPVSFSGTIETTCTNCGNAIPADSNFCPKCGQKK